MYESRPAGLVICCAACRQPDLRETSVFRWTCLVAIGLALLLALLLVALVVALVVDL